jgi:chromosome segregation ATPase
VYVQLQDLLQRLSGAQQLVQRVLDLETTNSQQQASITLLQQQLLNSEQQVAELSSQLAAWQGRGSRAEQQLSEVQQRLAVSTPRPKRELGLLMDLLTAADAQLVEQALIEGA